jgi:Endodeoxyribonuclease RusA
MTNQNLGHDEERIERLLYAIATTVVDARPTIVTLYGAPRAWQRPRLHQGRYLTDKAVRALVKDWIRVWEDRLPLEGRPVGFANLALVCLFYLPTRHIVDADNLTKLVMDAATKAHVWEDDSQVTTQLTIVDYAPAGASAALAQPRTVVGLVPIVSSLDRTVPLERRRRPSLPLAYKGLAGR